MAWNQARSNNRIADFLKTAPSVEENISLSKFNRDLAEARVRDSLPIRKAVVVEGAHVYGQLLDFDKLVGDAQGVETDASHRTLLTFLNEQYQVWDGIVEVENGNRVDYHGTRLHAVMSEPEGDPKAQIERAVALATTLSAATKRIASALGITARIRFGIDQGKCVAMTTGRAHEKDTLYLGAAANYAAKLAAAGNEEGIFVSERTQRTIGIEAVERTLDGRFTVTSRFRDEAVRRHPFARLDAKANKVIAGIGRNAAFAFHRGTPPLSEIKFSDLSPSKSVRMGMASIFADIDGYTKFVDESIAHGAESIRHAVKAVHVIREELNAVLRYDFGGKRIRFIGDCIQGALAKGATRDDPEGAITDAYLCASGMKSSFLLCQKIVGGIESLDLAIGLEYGPTPMTRIGNVGDESVRCSVSKGTVNAERTQQTIDGGGIKLGPAAQSVASTRLKGLVLVSHSLPSYDSAVDLLGVIASPAVQVVRDNPEARPYLRAEQGE